MGGLGAGCICLNGHGGLQDFSIRHRPHFSAAYPGRNKMPDSGFALLRTGGTTPATRLVEGPLPRGKVYDQGLWTAGQDMHRGGYEGLPRFRRCRFSSGYPFGRVALSDPKVPLAVEITGWSPFIPLDDVASGIPCAIIEYTLENKTSKAVDFEFSYHLSHLAVGAEGGWPGARSQVLPGKGVAFSNTEPTGADSFGTASLTTIGHRPKIKAGWPDGGWFDVVSRLWKEVKLAKFQANDGKDAIGRGARKGGSILVKGRLAPGRTTTIPVVIAWHFPNSSFQSYGWFDHVAPGFVPRENVPVWRPFYVSQWANASEVATYVHRHYEVLRKKTVAFQNALLSSTLPPEILDAITANLAILKSPTFLRQENGNVWGWEGCGVENGSCSGTCTHVWNYAQALPHLFPALERTLREQEYCHSMDERGHVSFRASLPDGPAPHAYHAAADGQLGGLLKLFRDWQISGDMDWLRRLYPLARRSLEYCIATWDPERRGALVEPHHNTYDIEFWGPDGMCGSIYQAALSAMAAMAHALGEQSDAEQYKNLAVLAAQFMEDVLFNGEYFVQKIQYRGLRDKSFLERLALKKDDIATQRLLRREGPPYQYGNGCLSDGVIGAWMASIYGVKTSLNLAKVRKHLLAIHRHNFRSSLVGHENTQRPGYAMEEEGGLLLCSWPRGGKPTLPFIYSDEVWTGIEYQVASHLAAEGYPRQSLDIVRAARQRYDGGTRNPWNEYECGSYYARAMASFALLPSWTGFRYSAVEKTLWFGPAAEKRTFQSFFVTASGYGSILLDRTSLTVKVLEGFLAVDQIVVRRGKKSVEKQVGKIARPAKPIRVLI
jgi:uncharacterized protein (DUF608 family)